MTPRLRFRVLALLAALTCVSCGSSAGGRQQAAGGDGEVEFMYFGGPAEAAGYEQVVAAFAETDGGTRVATSPVADKSDLLARLTTSFLAGDPPDVFLLNYREYGQFAARGALREVQGLLEDSDLAESDFFAAPLDAFRFDGTDLTCLPQNISSLVAYVNVDLLRARGVTVPRAGWGWDDLVRDAERLTDPGAGVYGLGTSPDLVRLAPFVWSNGGELVDDDQRPTRLTIHTPQAREALDFFLDLSLVHSVVPPAEAEASLDAESRFLSGQLGFYLDSRRLTPTLKASAGFAWTAVPLPVAPGGRPTSVLHADAYCLAEDGDVEDAWRFVRYAASSQGQQVLAASGRIVPSRRDVASTPVFRRSAPPGVAEVFLDNAEIVRATPRVAAWPELEQMADSVLAEAFYGRLDRQEAVRRLDQESRRILGGR